MNSARTERERSDNPNPPIRTKLTSIVNLDLIHLFQETA